MKGISAVLATVLIVVITVAIIGMAYGWATGMFKMTTGSASDATNAEIDKMQKRVEIVASSCYNETAEHCKNILVFTIKNTGTDEISVGELSAFVDSSNIENLFILDSENSIDETSLSSGEVKQLRYKTSDTSYFSNEKEINLKVSAPAGNVEENLICPNIVICIDSPVIPINPN